MTASALPSLSLRTRAALITAAGIAIILLSAGAALLPAERGISGAVLGSLLIAAGVVELAAGMLRQETRIPAMAAGTVTMLAGLLFIVNGDSRIFPAVNLVIAWLAVRSLMLGIASRRTGGGVRRWVIIAAVTDFLLALILLLGLSLALVVILLFGPTPQIIASFAWVFALSFVATGLMLLEVASCERDTLRAREA